MSDSGGIGALYGKVKHELFTVSRFTIVGLIAALVHIGAVWFLIDRLDWSPFAANLLAFLTAFSVSFTGQYYWTFRSDRAWHHALIRFFAVSLAAFTVNNIVLSSLLLANFTSPALSAVIAATVIPVFTYVLGRFWAFA